VLFGAIRDVERAEEMLLKRKVSLVADGHPSAEIPP
jgi:hypothetical protein